MRPPFSQNHIYIWKNLFVFLVIFSLIVLRNPARLFHAQLWAEDGLVFMETAFQTPLEKNLFTPNLGYLQVLQRILSEVSIIDTWYESTPFFMNFWAILTASCCIFLFTTPLYSRLINSWIIRCILAFCIALGGAHHEIIGNITNLHSYLSLVGIHMLVYFYASNIYITSRFKALLWGCIIFIIVISCPYFLTFLPLFWLVIFYKEKSFSKYIFLTAVTIGCIFQATSYIRYRTVVIPMISNQVVDFQSNIFYMLQKDPYRLADVIKNSYIMLEKKVLIQNFVPSRLILLSQRLNIEWVLTLYSTVGLAYYFFLTKKRLFVFLLVLSCLLFLSQFIIFRPAGIEAIAKDSSAGTYSGRYFLLTYTIALLIGFIAVSQTGKKQFFFYLFFLLQVFAGLNYWKTSIHEIDYNWKDSAARIRQLKSGENVLIRVNPAGWGVLLTKP